VPGFDARAKIAVSRLVRRSPPPNRTCQDKSILKYRRSHRWDFGMQFHALAKAVKSRTSIHELRHAGATIIGAIRASPLSSDLEDA
jgi:hypothetical protein